MGTSLSGGHNLLPPPPDLLICQKLVGTSPHIPIYSGAPDRSPIMSRASKFKTTTNSCWVIYSVLKSECQKRKQKTPLYIDSNRRVGNMYFNVILIVEFQRWGVLKIKIFIQRKSLYYFNTWRMTVCQKKCQNLTLKVNSLCQE